ncbi:MAG: sulfatase-like hydrolase/transferase [bacterium]|nr:sulfatase-like hydrolase/transferase [bacterium]
MSRRHFLAAAGALGLAACAPPRARGASGNGPPNIVLLLADDLGYRDLTCFGGTNPTPNLDALADGGMRLTHFYAAAPVCTPTRASIITGRYPLRFDIRKHFSDGPEHLPENTVTLPKLLKHAGYQAGHAGKWHLGGLHVGEDGQRLDTMPGPAQHGFDHYQCQIEQQPIRGTMGRNRTLFRKGGTCLIRDGAAVPESDPYYNRHFTDINGDYAVELVRRFAKEGEPFFLNVWWLVPHKPYEPAPEPHWTATAEDGISDDQHRFRSMVRHMDAKIGDIVATLRELDLLDNTLIVFTSDNGGAYEANIGDLKGGKTDLHDGGLRVPFIAHWPDRIPAGTSSDDITSTIDLLPTFCEAAKVSVPDGLPIDGTSLLGLLSRNEPLPDRDRFWQIDLYKGLQRHYPKPKPYATEVMVSGPWKLLTLKGKPVELFHIRKDFLESTNLIAELPDRAEAMAARVRAWLDEPRHSWEDAG